jgi:1,2-diacylglycerol 3-alpha-glucosyltransferase
MRILFGTDLFYQNTAGSSNFINQLAKGLTKKGHQIFIIAPSKTFKHTVNKEADITIFGIRSVVIPEIIYPSKFRIPITAGSNKIRNIIKEIKPDIIHVQDHFMIGDQVTKEAKKLKIPLLGTNHFMPENFIHYLYPLPFAKNQIKQLAWKTFLRVYKHMDIITTPTKTAVDLITNLGLKNPIIAISNGVDLKKFNTKNNGLYLKKKYKLDNAPLVLFVGRLDKEKHIDILIRSFAKVLPNLKCKLIITGKGTEKQKLITLAKKLGVDKNIVFTGFVSNEDLPNLYRIADLFAISSIAELQSIATLEALASGLPVVAVNAVALPELVLHGKNGYLFEEGDIDALAKHMENILKDSTLKTKMSKKSLEVVKKHNIDNTVKSYEDVYLKLIRS